MRPINLAEIKELINVKNNHLISVYLNTHRFGKEVKENQDAITFKGLIQKSEHSLKEKGVDQHQIADMLKPAYDLIENNNFWRHQLDGLAVFIGEGFFKVHHLPYPVAQQQNVSNRFMLKPLLYSFSDNNIYYILTLSLDRIRLLEATEYGIHELNLENILPEGVQEVLSYYQFQDQLQMRSQQAGTTGQDKIYHGHGGSKSDNTPYIAEYFRKVNDALSQFFIASSPSRVVLAGVEYLIPIFKDTSQQLDIADEFINGNHDDTRIGDLHEKANEIMAPYQKRMLHQRADKYQELAGSGKASYDLEEIVKASVNGRIESLFITKNSQKWGKLFSEAEPKVEIHTEYQDDDNDLLDITAVNTILASGETYFVEKEEIPEDTVDTDCVAVFRY